VETKNREKLLLIVTAAVAAIYLLNLLVVSPLIDGWHARSDEIAKLRKQIEDGNMLVRRGPSIKDRWDTMKANALPDNPTAAERQMFTSFDRWVGTRVTEGSFRPEVQEGDTNYTTVDSRSDVSGSLDNVVDFVRAMSRDPLANKVQAFELAARDDNGRQLTLGLSLSGLILTGSDPSEVQAPPAPAPTLAADSNPTNTDTDPFTIIARNNIFDQSRVYSDRYTRAPVHVPKVDTIACNGVASDHGRGQAYLEGSGVHTQDLINIGDIVADLKLAEVTKTTVTLTNATNSFTLPADGSESLRREDDGPWKLSGQIVETTPTTTTNSTATNGASATAATSGSSIEEILKKRRESE
jgi:hypothetical protein